MSGGAEPAAGGQISTLLEMNHGIHPPGQCLWALYMFCSLSQGSAACGHWSLVIAFVLYDLFSS
jgi:hypothetical protein